MSRHIKRQDVRLKFDAPREIRVDREEVWQRRIVESQIDRATDNALE